MIDLSNKYKFKFILLFLFNAPFNDRKFVRIINIQNVGLGACEIPNVQNFGVCGRNALNVY